MIFVEIKDGWFYLGVFVLSDDEVIWLCVDFFELEVILMVLCSEVEVEEVFLLLLMLSDLFLIFMVEEVFVFFGYLLFEEQVVGCRGLVDVVVVDVVEEYGGDEEFDVLLVFGCYVGEVYVDVDYWFCLDDFVVILDWVFVFDQVEGEVDFLIYCQWMVGVDKYVVCIEVVDVCWCWCVVRVVGDFEGFGYLWCLVFVWGVDLCSIYDVFLGRN